MRWNTIWIDLFLKTFAPYIGDKIYSFVKLIIQEILIFSLYVCYVFMLPGLVDQMIYLTFRKSFNAF